MKSILFFLFSVSCSFGLTEDEIIAFSEKPHDEVELRKELQIFPVARKVSSEITIKMPNRPDHKDVIHTTSKNIDGKYRVHETNIVNEDAVMKFIHVVTFSDESKMYKMWTRSYIKVKDIKPITIVVESDGMHIKGSRFITWSQVPQKGKDSHFVVISELRPEGEKWISYDYRDGKLVSIIEGTDKIIKK